MTRNQKIALGCGGAGCLGLIVIAIAGGLIYYFAVRPAAYRASRDYNFNVNLNSNSNDNANENSDDSTDNVNSDSSSSSSPSVSSMSDDDKHRLFQAATMTSDSEVISRVNLKLGLWKDQYTPSDAYGGFVKDHAVWIFQNLDFIQSIGTPEEARAYVDQHLPE